MVSYTPKHTLQLTVFALFSTPLWVHVLVLIDKNDCVGVFLIAFEIIPQH